MSVINVGASLAFIDTNIWLYAFSSSQDQQKTERAKLLLRQTTSIALSTQVINELSFNMLRKFHADEQDIRKLIRSLYRKYLVVEFSREILLHASNLRTAYNVSYWDSLIMASALGVGASMLYSEDMHDGLIVNNQLTVRNPLQPLTNP